ncbi:MAG: NAD(P)/FAD-dependent oxidoreductase [Jatrophihabitantaceae bacterium]
MSELPHAVDVVVVGAGLAGLAAARKLTLAGRQVLLAEAADAVGGRVRTDQLDGLLLDRGFQLLNPAYPEVRRVVDLDALRLQPFEAGAVIAHGSGRGVVGDPRRLPRDLPSTLRLPLGSWREKIALARWAVEIGYGPVKRLKAQADLSLAEALGRRGLDGALTSGVLRPFLAGVLGEDELATSAVFAELLVRSFVRGTPAIPAGGMQALPEQLAAGLPAGTLSLLTKVNGLHGSRVETDRGEVRARAVLVAADPVTAATLTGLPSPTMRALTTFYYLAERPPTDRALLHLDADRRGPLVNTAVISNAAPSYAPGRHLVAATTLGSDASTGAELAARKHAGLIYGCASADWELVASYPIAGALPDTPPGTLLRRDVRLGEGRYVAGDHRDTSSIQGALVSGRRAAEAVLADLR